MSFITKRERVFNEYDLFDLPARNEGKLKAYASCTDARAWSHFCSDKTEHLVEIIKRNNEVCRPKYVPTEAIVNTLLAHKQTEIARLKRKIEEFEQMVAAYDDLELTCEQKCEIAKAHATIKEANKDLNELWFDLDLSGYTGIDSEDYETGKSRGDEASKVKSSLEEDGGYELGSETPRSRGSRGNEQFSEKELRQKVSKGNQAGQMDCRCDASTNVVDPRIQEMRDVIISKDAKLNAMKNTYAVIENDACEPYCIYAHIYTALEKIFGILCQNDKYKLYLNLMTAGKDIRGIDIKGRILFKLKVLEKFSLALLAPCSRDIDNSQSNPECSCYRAEIVPNIEAAYALTSAETTKPLVDNKRAQLVADIMENDEMKELLNKDSKLETDDEDVNDGYNINQENVKRLKNLQQNYDDLVNCYETLKHEKDCLHIRCRKYEEIETEFEKLQTQLREYNSLWNEKEHYRKRSLDLDALKEQYFVLCDETTGLETELKAESEINDVKTKTIDELRSDNIELERKLNDAAISFEKERNCAQCKLKESECKIMCQGQQIKSLSIQIDRLLEQGSDKLQPKQAEATAIAMIDEMNSLKEQIKNLQDALFCTEEENQQLQLEYQNKLNLINDLKMQIEDWKSNYEKTTNFCNYEVQKLIEDNRILSQDAKEKQNAIDNLMNALNNKSQDIDKLIEELEQKSKENSDLYAEIRNLHDSYSKSITALDSEKSHALQSLRLSKKESQELLEKVKDYDDLANKQENISVLYHKQNEEYNRLKSLLMSTQKENETLQMDLTSRENNNSILLQEIQRLQEVNNFAVNNISALQDEKKHYQISLELTKKDSKIIEDRLHSLEDLSYMYQQLKESHEKLIQEKCKLENKLANKTSELDDAILTINLTKKESERLVLQLKSSEHIKADFESVDNAYKKLVKEQQRLQKDLDEKKQEFDSLLESYDILQNNLKRISDQSPEEVENLSRELLSLKQCYNELLAEKNNLQNDCDGKNEEINNLYNTLEKKIEENKALSEQLQLLELYNRTVQGNINTLQEEHYSTTNDLNALRKESEEIMDRVQFYETLESKYDQLKKEYEQMKGDNCELQNELEAQRAKLRKIAEDNEALHNESQHLLSHSEDLENALINERTKLIGKNDSSSKLHMDIMKQIDEMKKEKTNNAIKIRDLLNKLDESESIISDLSENILASDDKIAILQNHINELQDEVKRLHRCLAEVVDTGEQIKDISHKKITESLDTMEAHHSKATHNMKMEIAKLQSDKMKLEDNLSISKIKTEDSARDKHKYVSQIIHLQNEKEIIATDIKHLELRSVGDSILSPEHCDVKDILGSLERIGLYVDARSSKSTLLQQTLLKVQNSYQVVQSKADEAKKIVEKEKYKILNEKEDAIRDRINMEKQLTDLKEQLEKQMSHDKNVIKDLEAEILNQKLICEKLNTSTKNYISKLKEEMQSLQEIYQKSLENISELENRIQLMSDEKNTHLDIIKTVHNKLQEKMKEVDILQKNLESFKNKPSETLGIQVSIVNNRDKETQTYEEFLYEGYDQYEDKDKIKNETRNHDAIRAEKSVALERKIGHTEQLKQVNEIQVLVANVEPTFDYVRNSYLNQKLKNLSHGRLEQYSISCTSNFTELDTKDITEPGLGKSGEGISNSQSNENVNVIDIYNKQSIHTNSSKNIGSNFPENEKSHPRSPGKTSAITDFGLTVESFDTKTSINKASNLFGSVSGISTDKDLFVIYKDSESNKYDKKNWPEKKRSITLVQPPIQRLDRYGAKSKIKQNDVDNDTYSYLVDDELIEDDSVKNKLKINLPRVETDSPTIDISSDCEKKSLDSYNIRNSISNDETKFLESYVSTEEEKLVNNVNKQLKRNKTNFNENFIPDPLIKQKVHNSRHRLSRTDADVRLIRSKTGHTMNENSADGESNNNEKLASHFGLDYIHATADNFKIYDAASALRKTRSDEMFGLVTFHEKTESNPSRLSEVNNVCTDYKAISANGQSSYIIHTKQKEYIDQEVLVKLDPIDEYETQIKNLTNNLENIEKDYKKKIEAIKIQYDSNIRSILNEHNEGVKSIQGLHEETMQDIIKHHENEVENLRSMSIEAMRKADKLEKEVRCLKYQIPVCSATCLNEEPIKMLTPELVKHRLSRVDTKTLTKTNVEAFNVRPKSRSNGPCTCSLDVNISDTVRNIFQQVDVDQRKIAEQTYLKYIANKILTSTVEALDCQELSFLHLKVCRIWKVKLSKEETLQKRISSLEAEVIHKQRHNQHNIAELDRQVAEERRRLQEVREAVCRNVPTASRYNTFDSTSHVFTLPSNNAEDRLCSCNAAIPGNLNLNIDERKSAGDLVPHHIAPRQKRTKPDSNRAVLAKLDAEERRERKPYSDEPPTRLRRANDRHLTRPAKK